MSETVRLNMDEMIKRFKFLGKDLPKTIYAAMLVSGQEMLRKGVEEHMSRPSGPKHNYSGSGPGQLGRDLGNARRSMIAQTMMDASRVGSLIGSPLAYVRAHEEGFDGAVQVRAHMRRLIRLQRNTKTGMVSKTSARAYKAALRRGGKRIAYVRAHDRQVNIEAKHFIRDTVLESVAPTEQRILRALKIATLTGRVPTASEMDRAT